MTTFSKAVSDVHDRGFYTFVAEAVGGPVHGRLYRWPDGVERMLVPDGLLQVVYNLHVQPDGRTIWLYDDGGAAA